MMCNQLKEHKECAIFPQDEETQANQQEREHERACAFEYLSDSWEVRDRIAKETPHSHKQEKENQVDSHLGGHTMSKQGNIDTEIIRSIPDSQDSNRRNPRIEQSRKDSIQAR